MGGISKLEATGTSHPDTPRVIGISGILLSIKKEKAVLYLGRKQGVDSIPIL